MITQMNLETPDADLSLNSGSLSPQARFALLSAYTTEEREFRCLKPDAKAPYPKEWDDFYKQCCEYRKLTVRVYHVAGCPVPIYVPEEYAVQLDEVRNLRFTAWPEVEPDSGTSAYADMIAARGVLAPHPLRTRMMPEHAAEFLSLLPIPEYFDSVTIFGCENPGDVKDRIDNNNNGICSAASVTSDRLVLFWKWANPDCTWANLAHEWTHIFEKRFPIPMFSNSITVEGFSWLPDWYALASKSEHLAIFAQQVMSIDVAWFRKVVTKFAPTRSFVWACRFSEMLDTVVVTDQNREMLTKWRNRVSFIKAVAENAAREAIAKSIKESTELLTTLFAQAAEAIVSVDTVDVSPSIMVDANAMQPLMMAAE